MAFAAVVMMLNGDGLDIAYVYAGGIFLTFMIGLLRQMGPPQLGATWQILPIGSQATSRRVWSLEAMSAQ